MSQRSHSNVLDVNFPDLSVSDFEAFDVNYDMDPSSLGNEGYQGVASVLSTARSANMIQYPATEIGNSQSALSAMNQGSSELSSELSSEMLNGGLYRYHHPFERTPMSSLLPSTNPSAIVDISDSQVEPKSHTPPGNAKRERSAVWTSEAVRPIEGRLVLALLFKYMPKPTMEDMENISNDTGYPFDFVIDSYRQNKNSGRANGVFLGNNATVGNWISMPGLTEAHNLSSTGSAYGPQMESKNFAQPVVKRARAQKDPNLPANQAVNDSCQKHLHRCGLCPRGFTRQAELRRHIKTHYPADIECPHPGCDRSFNRQEHLNIHYNKKHRDSSSSAPQMPVLGYDDPENGPGSGNYPGLDPLFGGAWNSQGGNSWQSSQSGSTSMNSGCSAPSGSSYMRDTFEGRLEEICYILAHKSAAEYMKMLAGGEVIKKLGRGGFGSVYEVSVSQGFDMDRKSFACKVIRLPRHRRNEAIQRAQNEISMLRVLDHPNTIKFAGACAQDDFLFINSLPVADSNLKLFLSEQPPSKLRISNRQIWEAVHGLASAIAYLHEMAMVHFDVKPNNTLVRYDNDLTSCTQFILADFGSAQILALSQNEFRDQAVTARYCAPEWFKDNGKRGSHCDVFSFGCILAEIFGWTKSFIPHDFENFRNRRMGYKRDWTYYESLPAMDDWLHSLSLTGRSDYTSLIMEMLRPNHQERPSAADVVATLDSIAQEHQERPSAADVVATLDSIAQEKARQRVGICDYAEKPLWEKGPEERSTRFILDLSCWMGQRTTSIIRLSGMAGTGKSVLAKSLDCYIGAWRRHQEGSVDKSYVFIGFNDWLLNFDNCDDPNQLFSTLAQELEDMNTGMAILSRRPGRVLSHSEIKSELDIFEDCSLASLDWNVLDSARRQDSFSIDLATAGTYLGQSNISYNEYLGITCVTY